jgi:C-terminal processing protease CtpA/Prc
MRLALSKKSLIILLQSALLLLCVWFLWQPFNEEKEAEPLRPGSAINHKLKQLTERIDSLENEIQSGLSVQQQLESRLLQLEESTINRLSSNNDSPQLKDKQASTNNAQSQDNLDQAEDSIQEKLVKQGLPGDTAMMIQDFIDTRRLQRLELRNQAIRDGTRDSAEFFEQMQQLGNISKGLRDQYGEQAYDHYLYASGQPNRVVVDETIGGSAAESIGIQAGDMIISYANQPIYAMNELRTATTQGISGEGTLIEIKRDNQIHTLTVPRGPLGVLMTPARVKP